MRGCPWQIAGSGFTREEIEEAVENRRLLAIEVELSGARDLQHGGCDLGEESAREEELSEQEICEVILQGRDLGARRIMLVCGEAPSYPDVLEVIRFSRAQGLAVEMLVGGNAQEIDWLPVDSEGLRELFAETAEIDREQYAESCDPQPPLFESGCMRNKFACRVCSQGDVVPCVGLRIPIGNIREQPLREIIGDSEVLEDLRDHRQTIKGPCSSCERADICFGCRGSAYASTGDYLGSDPLCWRNADRQDEIARLPFPADQIIPQRAPMRVVDAVVCTGERSGEVSVTVSDEMPFVGQDGALDPVAYLEMMAQAMAALNGFKRLGSPKGAAAGYLVGAHKLEVLASARVGDRLRILLYKSSRFGNFGTVKGTVSRNGSLLARGEIRVWQDAIGSGEAATDSKG